MAGGKETPRQKMIGMMYLVLTALLALNVSKSILDAFVAIEENIQTANLTELYRGDEKRSELLEVSADKSNAERAIKAKKYATVVDKIDAMTAVQIQKIDQLKLEILRDCGEDVISVGPKSIITEKYDAKLNQCKPIRMNLDLVNSKDKYDDPMRIMLGDAVDIKKPTGKGLELWNSIIQYRSDITELLAASRIRVADDKSLYFDKAYSFEAPAINDFQNQKELDQKIKSAIKASKVHPDEQGVILEVYRGLSKNTYSTVHDMEGVHWLGKTFDHAPSVAAIASLSSLQKDILEARAQAIAHVRGRVGGGDYNFSTIIPLAYGPEVVNQGEDFDVSVLMAVYDTDKQPRVTMNGQPITSVRDGMGVIKVKGTNGTMELKGTVAIQNKQGIWNEREWSKTIQVIKPSGSIEMEEMNVLYRGYENKVNATASGYPETQLSGDNVTISKNGTGYIVKPKSGGSATLTVSGRTPDGKVVQLKRMNFKVRNLPKPTLYWGAAEDGGKANSSRVLIPKFTPDIVLNAQFKVIEWTCFSSMMKGPPVKGKSSDLSALSGIYNNAPAGSFITIQARVVGPDNIIQNINGTWMR